MGHSKKYCGAFLFIILFPLFPLAQDIIKLKSGEEMNVKIIRVGEKEIEYKKQDNLTGPLYAVSKEQVTYYNYNVSITQTQGRDVNSSDALVRLLQAQIKRDSLYLGNIKKVQEALIEQSEIISANMTRLVDGILKQSDADQDNTKKQLDKLAEQQEKLQEQLYKISNKTSSSNQVEYNWHEKNSAVAFGHAAFPGLGYMYCGQVNKGYAFMAGVYGGLIGGSILLLTDNASEVRFVSYILLAGGAGTYLYQLIDAPYAAQRVNQEHGLAMKKINIEPIFTANALGVRLKFRI